MESVEHGDRKEVVRDDFLESLKKIDFSKEYNPFSVEFDAALRLGLMWHLMRELDSTSDKKKIAEVEKADNEIADEIMSAKRDLQKYIENKDETYRSSAEEKLNKAEAMLKKAYSRLPSGEEKARLKEQESEIAAVRGQM
jgi:DNA topoisomerase VI subunit B